LNPRDPISQFFICVAVLSLIWVKPLVDWFRFALGSDTFSYVILVPAISVYLGRWEWRRKAWNSVRSAKPALFFGLGAVIPLAVYGLGLGRGWKLETEDRLALVLLAYWLTVVAGGFWFFGGPVMRRLRFPLGFLILMVPLPSPWINALEIFFQHTSAQTAYWLLKLTDTPMLRDGLVFQLPGIVIQVAQECSGIRSSLVLFMTSLIAGHLFLKSPWKRAAFALAVVPLGIARNGFRILVIALLCVHVGPDMIHSPIHHHGGPLFFVLSLIPFFLLLFVLRKSEKAALDPGSALNELGASKAEPENV
jgi:exosortase C (VPDSG-CTERM-specific)